MPHTKKRFSTPADHLPLDPLAELLQVTRGIDLRLQNLEACLKESRKPLLTVEEFADLCGRSAYTVRRWHSEGRVKAVRVGGTGPRGRLLIAREELDRLIESGLGARVSNCELPPAS